MRLPWYVAVIEHGTKNECNTNVQVRLAHPHCKKSKYTNIVWIRSRVRSELGPRMLVNFKCFAWCTFVLFDASAHPSQRSIRLRLSVLICNGLLLCVAVRNWSLANLSFCRRTKWSTRWKLRILLENWSNTRWTHPLTRIHNTIAYPKAALWQWNFLSALRINVWVIFLLIIYVRLQFGNQVKVNCFENFGRNYLVSSKLGLFKTRFIRTFWSSNNYIIYLKK